MVINNFHVTSCNKNKTTCAMFGRQCVTKETKPHRINYLLS